MNSQTAIVPVVCGSRDNAMQMARLCQDKKLFVQAIPSPVVPKGTERLRTIVTAAHSKKDMDYSLNVIEEAGRRLGII